MSEIKKSIIPYVTADKWNYCNMPYAHGPRDIILEIILFHQGWLKCDTPPTATLIGPIIVTDFQGTNENKFTSFRNVYFLVGIEEYFLSFFGRLKCSRIYFFGRNVAFFPEINVGKLPFFPENTCFLVEIELNWPIFR